MFPDEANRYHMLFQGDFDRTNSYMEESAGIIINYRSCIIIKCVDVKMLLIAHEHFTNIIPREMSLIFVL